MIVQFALRSLGVGCVVRDFAGEYLEDGRLFELRFNKIIPKRQICLVTEESVFLSHLCPGVFENDKGGFVI